MMRARAGDCRALATGRRVLEAPGGQSLFALAVSVLVLMAIAGCRDDANSRASTSERPNVLLITLDTTRADYLGCYGRTTARTPNLDRLAREGTRFAQCSTCTSLTAPSHASILTGQYPFVHGVRQNGRHRVAESTQTLAEVLKAQGYRTHAILAASVLNRHCGLDQGFDAYDDVPSVDGASNPFAERKAGDVSIAALAALRELGETPFFLWVHFYDPHYPYESSQKQAEPVARYEEEITRMDAGIGVIVDALDRAGIANRTLLVAVGDHGEGLGDHGESFHGYFAYETTLRVPLIVRGPRVSAGRVVESVVRTIDVAPTILAMLGAHSMSGVQGTSLAEAMQSNAPDLSLSAYAEALEGYYNFDLSPIRVLRTGSWKYALTPAPELYQLAEDPREERNRAADQADLAASLREQLRLFIAEAPPPPSADARAASLNAAERARLESLGYVHGEASADEGTTELDFFEPVGNDPKDFAQALDAYWQSFWLLHAHDFAGAEVLLRKVVDAMPASPRAHSDLAFVLQSQNRDDEAVREYETAMQADPDSTYALRMYTGLLVHTKRWDKAEERLRQLIAMDPTNSDAWYNMGVTLLALNRTEESREHLLQAAALAPSDPRPLNAIGVLHTQMGDLPRAAEWFRKALGVDPSHRKSQRDLERILRMMGQP